MCELVREQLGKVLKKKGGSEKTPPLSRRCRFVSHAQKQHTVLELLVIQYSSLVSNFTEKGPLHAAALAHGPLGGLKRRP